MVIPNLLNDMHNGRDPQRIRRADDWIRRQLAGYAQWCRTHNSLLIITWDEDNHFWFNRTPNRIPTIIVGAGVKQGVVSTSYNHYNLLRTIEAMYGLPQLGGSAGAKVIEECWMAPGAGSRK